MNADLQNPKLMYIKAGLFVVIGVACFGLILLSSPTVKTAGLMVLMIWAFARVYYFMFYVIEKYADPGYRFSGIFSFLRYLLGKKPKR